MRRFDEVTVRLPVGDNDQTGPTRSSEPIIWSHPIWTIERLKRLPLEPDELGRRGQLEASTSRMCVDSSSDSIVTALNAGKRQ